ncbi:MAG: YcfL family protein [Desulfuromonadaceae bacterium]|nr:YcfL family protein [Desulfuromonadaceae bacterium]
MKQRGKYISYGIAAVLLLASTGLTGCSTTAGIEATGKSSWNDDGSRGLDKKVVFNNSGLKGDIEIVEMKSSQAGDLMRAQATLRSKDKATVLFQYRFDWYDAGGFEINSGAGSWKPLILTGRETKTIQNVAPDPRAKEFKLKLREVEK